jgi:hypothetical protein
MFVLTCGAAAGVRVPLWQKVREATQQGLPQTALQSLPEIIAAAERDHAWAEAVRGVVLRVALEARIQGNKPEEKITRLQAEVARVPAPMRPIMEAVLAEWYWQYFQDNRWRFMQRSQTATAPGDDFTTWDLKRIYAEIDLHFSRALADTTTLRQTSIGDWADLLGGGNSPDAYRPTLYDFVAFEALRFYQSGEQVGAKPEDAFVLRADGPVLDDAGAFVRWRPVAPDSSSPAFKAVRVYQRLLAWHAVTRDTAALLDADLWRIDFAHNTAVGANKADRCKRAYERLAGRWAGHELSSRALHAWAAIVQGEGDLVAARAIAVRGLERFPYSVGSNRCFNLIQEIEARGLNVSTESVWNDAHPVFDVRYRNLTAVHFRLVPWDYARGLRERRDPSALSNEDFAKAVAAVPVHAWAESLRGTPDYREAVVHLRAPSGVRPGPYVLLYSARPDFADGENTIGADVVWVSDLALVLRGLPGAVDGFVVDALSGEPVANADVRMWTRGIDPYLQEGQALRSDAAGHFRWTGVRHVAVVTATSGTRQLGVEPSIVAQDVRRYNASRRTVLFTDRAIYRPGQPIHFKGICIDVDQEHDRYCVIPAQAVTMELRDPNGKVVARAECRSNDYGAFSGEFVAPRDRLLGTMTLRVETGPDGEAAVRVEEYKRPRFFAGLDAPRTPARLDSVVTVIGHATAYTGAAVDGARVAWRVTRNVRYPSWWAWRYGWYGAAPASAQEMTHGETTVGADGRFEIRFVARPDPAVPAEQEPSFAFTIQADVTEPAGETRSAIRQVLVGYTLLAASVGAPDWLVADRPVALDVSVATLDGVPQAARGTLTVHRLRQPARVQRAQPALGGYDHWRWRAERAAGGARPDSSNPASWAVGEAVASLPVAIDTLGRRSVPVTLHAGFYRAVFEARDRNGRKVTAMRPLHVLQPAASHLDAMLPDFFRMKSSVVEVGEEFVALWGTGYDRGRAYVEVEHRGRLVQAYWTPEGATQAVIRQRVGPEMRGGFAVRVTMVRENRAYLHVENVSVPWSDRRLDLRWEHFVSHLRPGQHETWTAVITGPHAVRQAAEMVATLYDASLDAYAALGWPGGFGVFRTEYVGTQLAFGSIQQQIPPRAGYWTYLTRAAELSYRGFPYGLLTGTYDATLVPDRLALRRSAAGLRLRPSPGVEVGGRQPSRTYSSTTPPFISESRLSQIPVDNLSTMLGPKAGIVAQGEALHFRGGRAGEVKFQFDGLAGEGAAFGSGGIDAEPAPDSRDALRPNLDRIVARHNLRETAFFFPHLIANDRGEVRMEFTMPDAVTRWRFLGFAHDRDLRGGMLTGEAVTARELMVQPNPPRFLRERDTLEFTVKVTNLGASPQDGRVRLSLADAVTGVIVDAALIAGPAEQPFAVPAKESRTFAWRLHVPDDTGPLTYTAVAASATFSDGEDGALPVISRSILVTESMPMPVRGAKTLTFDFERLLRSGPPSTVRSRTLTLQMVSNPAWYAVMALPYLMEYPYECSEQTFNRLYANQLAQHIAGSDPRIRTIFARWRDTPALDSPLEKNADLKAVALLETPWVRQAQSESQARRRVGVLFDEGRLASECVSAYAKLVEMQRPDGAWPWFPGGPANDYLTLYITTGFGRLRHLGVAVPMDAALRSLRHLDEWSDGIYREVVRGGSRDANHLSPVIALYLYGRSFYLADEPFAVVVPSADRDAGHAHRGVRRGHAGLGRGGGLPRMAAQAEADAGLEDHEGDRRRGLRAAAARADLAGLGCARRGDARNAGGPAAARGGRHRFPRAALGRPRHPPRDGPRHGAQDRSRRGVGRPALAVPRRRGRRDRVHGHAAHPAQGALRAPSRHVGARDHAAARGRARGRRTGRAAGAARGPRHGVRAPQGRPRQRHRAGERALGLPLPGRAALLRGDARHRDQLLHRLPAQGHVRLRVPGARPAPRQLPQRRRRDPVHVRAGVQQPLGQRPHHERVAHAGATGRRSDPAACARRRGRGRDCGWPFAGV